MRKQVIQRVSLQHLHKYEMQNDYEESQNVILTPIPVFSDFFRAFFLFFAILREEKLFPSSCVRKTCDAYYKNVKTVSNFLYLNYLRVAFK
jgi:hypothetical protein